MKDVHFVWDRLSIQTPNKLYTEQFKGLVTNYGRRATTQEGACEVLP